MKRVKLAFIISHYYVRRYKSYILTYVKRLNRYYHKPYIIVVDNNSPDLSDIKEQLFKYSNVSIMTNDSDSKFEIGAYKYGINFLRDINAIEKFDYLVFSQIHLCKYHLTSLN